MNFTRFFSCVALFLATMAALPAASQDATARSETKEIQLGDQSQPALGLPPDVRLVIDVSGSMKRNDPNNLRQPAVDLLVQLLPDESKAGVWTFGRWVNMLVKHRSVDDAWRQNALNKSDQINSAGLFTNIGEALEKASYDLPAADEKYRSSIILLTDGMVDIDKDLEKNKREWRRIVDEVLPRLQRSGVAIHTIALSENADRDLLNKLSIGTDGITAVAKNADELMKIFLKAFEVAAPMEQVPLSDEGFVIDSSVEEFTALIFRENPEENTQLIGPDNEVLTAQSNSKYVSWYRDGKYDLITVKQPLEGQWQVLAAMDPESRVTVVSNLNLRVKPLPNNILKGHKDMMSFALQEDGKTITRPEFLSLMSISADISAGKDEFELEEIWRQDINTQAPPADGVFVLELPEFSQEGIYQLSLLVDGKSFVREFNHQFATRQPFGADIKEIVNNGVTEYLLTARAFAKEIDVAKTKVVATITSPDERKKIRPLSATDLDTWQTTVRPEIEGRYVATIRTRGEYKDGRPFDIELEALEFNYSIENGFVEQEKPFVAEAKPEPKPTAVAELEPSATPASEQAPGDAISTNEPIPAWMLYAALGLGNLLLFALGFFAYRKIMKPAAKDDILDQFSEEKVEEELNAAQGEQDEAIQEAADAEEEEPPMEDIDPTPDVIAEDEPPPMARPPEPVQETREIEDAVELGAEFGEELGEDLGLEQGETDQEASVELAADSGDILEKDDPEPSDSTSPEVGAFDASSDEDTQSVDQSAMDALDDLDQMAIDAEESAAEESEERASEDDNPDEDEDDDMVSAMLKAQGLDLAEDELDDAISSLIDELENDGMLDDDDDKKT